LLAKENAHEAISKIEANQFATEPRRHRRKLKKLNERQKTMEATTNTTREQGEIRKMLKRTCF
jgi:hypothetical protein